MEIQDHLFCLVVWMMRQRGSGDTKNHADYDVFYPCFSIVRHAISQPDVKYVINSGLYRFRR